MADTSMDTNYNTALTTLALLEERLNRISYLLHGDNPTSPRSTSIPAPSRTTADQEDTAASQPKAIPKSPSAAEQLHKLERSLSSLAAKSPTVTDILDLQKQHPSLFHASTQPRDQPTLPPSQLAALVLSHAHLYSSTSTSLQQLSSSTQQKDPLPDPATLSHLASLQPRISRLAAKQAQQSKEVAELRARSARVVERWYEDGVLGMGEKWAEWEEGLREGEILVRRAEARRRREDGEGVV